MSRPDRGPRIAARVALGLSLVALGVAWVPFLGTAIAIPLALFALPIGAVGLGGRRRVEAAVALALAAAAAWLSIATTTARLREAEGEEAARREVVHEADQTILVAEVEYAVAGAGWLEGEPVLLVRLEGRFVPRSWLKRNDARIVVERSEFLLLDADGQPLAGLVGLGDPPAERAAIARQATPIELRFALDARVERPILRIEHQATWRKVRLEPRQDSSAGPKN